MKYLRSRKDWDRNGLDPEEEISTESVTFKTDESDHSKSHFNIESDNL